MSTTLTPPSTDAGVPLHDLPVGPLAAIVHMDEQSHPMMIRLKTMGMHVGRPLRKVRSGSRMIVNCGGTRIGMTAEVARHIRVQPLADDSAHSQAMDA